MRLASRNLSLAGVIPMLQQANRQTSAGGLTSDNREIAIETGAFVGNTASLRGRIRAAAKSSIWYGCRLDAAAGDITIGARSNIQDNSVLAATQGLLAIGADSTIGHNVSLASCTIGNRCLIGIGSRVAPGTVAQDDVFLAAGAVTLPGQVLEGGWLWGGQPARKLTELNQRKRAVVLETIVTYCEYAEELARVQAQAAPQAA